MIDDGKPDFCTAHGCEKAHPDKCYVGKLIDMLMSTFSADVLDNAESALALIYVLPDYHGDTSLSFKKPVYSPFNMLSLILSDGELSGSADGGDLITVGAVLAGHGISCADMNAIDAVLAYAFEHDPLD